MRRTFLLTLFLALGFERWDLPKIVGSSLLNAVAYFFYFIDYQCFVLLNNEIKKNNVSHIKTFLRTPSNI